jgi:hypothetical protein
MDGQQFDFQFLTTPYWAVAIYESLEEGIELRT